MGPHFGSPIIIIITDREAVIETNTRLSAEMHQIRSVYTRPLACVNNIKLAQSIRIIDFPLSQLVCRQRAYDIPTVISGIINKSNHLYECFIYMFENITT